ncbi:TRAP transporter large permease subunit [Paenibacillus sp. 1P07SE]|uniref:TRAP transporter large permease subunit n=1 Tax=Paenibacillus sp. 1P07SE TaxID=3132209 RepID=UPI0039A6E1BD
MDEAQQKKIHELEGGDRELRGSWGLIVMALCIVMSLFHFYSAGFGIPVRSTTYLIFHLTIALVLVFLIYPVKKGLGQTSVPWYDMLLALGAAFVGFHIIQNQAEMRILSGKLTGFDLAVGVLLVVLVLEAARRVVGKPLVIIAGIFIGYFFLGEFLPGQFHHSRGGLTMTGLNRFISEVSFLKTGIFGTPIYASAYYVFIFILFGAILETTGAGKMFIDLALRACGRYKGGPAKAAVVASAG